MSIYRNQLEIATIDAEDLFASSTELRCVLFPIFKDELIYRECVESLKMVGNYCYLDDMYYVDPQPAEMITDDLFEPLYVVEDDEERYVPEPEIPEPVLEPEEPEEKKEEEPKRQKGPKRQQKGKKRH